MVNGNSQVVHVSLSATEAIGCHMGLPNEKMFWADKGVCWNGISYNFNKTLQWRAAPDVLLSHCGRNDLGLIPGTKLFS